MALAVAQSKFLATPGGSGPFTITFSSALTAGNTVYLFVMGSYFNGTLPSAAWTLESTNGPGGATGTQYLLSRTVQAGDGTTPPAIMTSTNAGFRIIGIEISGNPSVESIVQSTSASAPIAGPTTAHANDLGLLASGSGAGFGAYTPATGWTSAQNDAGGSTTLDYVAVPIVGTSLTASPSWSVGGTSAHWMSVALTPAAAPKTATGGMAFGGIKFGGAGDRTETATGGMAFGGIKFAASGTDRHTGVGGMHFGGIAIHANAADLGKGPASTLPPSTIQNSQLQPTTWNVPIVDKNTGFPSPEFQRKWQKQFAILEAQAKVNAAVVPKAYINALVTSALGAAQTYSDSGDTATLSAANSYTDGKTVTLNGHVVSLGGSLTLTTTDIFANWSVSGGVITQSVPGGAASYVVNGETGATLQVNRYSTNANASQVSGRKARGTIASPSSVTQNDVVFQQVGSGYGTTAFQNVATVRYVVEEPTPSDTAMGGSVRFLITSLGAVTAPEVLRLLAASQRLLGPVQIGGGVAAAPTTSAILDLSSTTGALLVPRMTTTQKNALTATNGMIVYDTTLGKFQGYEAGAWANLI